MSSENMSLSKAMEDEFIQTSLDLTIDYMEITLDSFSDFLSDIPLIKTIYGAYKIGIATREKYFIKKLLAFFQEFHTGNASEEDIKAFNDKFSTDDGYRQRVIEHTLVLVDRLETVRKSKILAHLLKNHTLGHYDWVHFTYLSASLDRLHPKGLETIQSIGKTGNIYTEIHVDAEHFDLLNSAGLAYERRELIRSIQEINSGQINNLEALYTGSSASKRYPSSIESVSGMNITYHLNKLGQDFYQFGLSSLSKNNPSK